MVKAMPDPPQAVASRRDGSRRRRRWEDETDLQLARDAGDGDDDAWRELHRRYDGLVRAIARRTGCRGTAVGDISQRAWELLFRSLDTIRDATRIPGWLATTTRREALRELTRRVPEPVDLETVPAKRLSSMPSPETIVVHRETRADVHAAVRALPPTYRTVVSRFLADDIGSYREIATSLDLPIGSIGPMRARGLRLLQRELA